MLEADLPQARKIDVETPWDTGPTSKNAPGIIEILGSPSYTDFMPEEARSGKERSNEGARVQTISFVPFATVWGRPFWRVFLGWVTWKCRGRIHL